jgi:hypothetical protein
MMKGKFKAGVHPYEGKEYSGDKEIKRLENMWAVYPNRKYCPLK